MSSPSPRRDAQRFRANHVDQPEEAEADLARIGGLGGRIARGGHLYLSSTSLTFIPHRANIVSGYTVDIPVRTIVSMRTGRHRLSALLTVTTLDGTEHVFVCWSRRKIIKGVQDLLMPHGPVPPGLADHPPAQPPSPPRADWP